MPGQAQPESVEDRVRRLRAAHLAARQHKVSRFDQVVGTSRRFFDAAHKFTVMGLIGFSGTCSPPPPIPYASFSRLAAVN